MLCAGFTGALPAYCTDYSKKSVAQLIDELTEIDSRAPGVDSAAIYDGFIAYGDPGKLRIGVPGISAPKVPPQMRELVRRGPLALPELIEHIDDRRPTKLEVGPEDTAKFPHDPIADSIKVRHFGDEYDPRVRVFPTELGQHIWPPPHWKRMEGRYRVKVGDVCFVLIGQIVNRRLLAVYFVCIAGLVVNSPIVAPALAEKVRSDWGRGDAEVLKSSLLADIRADSVTHSDDEVRNRTEEIDAALERLRLYFPGAYKALVGDDLKKRIEFERQEGRLRPAMPR